MFVILFSNFLVTTLSKYLLCTERLAAVAVRRSNSGTRSFSAVTISVKFWHALIFRSHQAASRLLVYVTRWNSYDIHFRFLNVNSFDHLGFVKFVLSMWSLIFFFGISTLKVAKSLSGLGQYIFSI